MPPTKGDRGTSCTFFVFVLTMENLTWNGPEWGRKLFSRLIRILRTFWAARIYLNVFDAFGFQIPKRPSPQICQVPRFPIFKFLNAAAGRPIRSQPEPSPKASKLQIRRKEPLLRHQSKSCQVYMNGKLLARATLQSFQRTADAALNCLWLR